MNAKPQAAVLLNKSAGVATITLNRPKRLNALSEEVILELQGILNGLAASDDLRCVVLEGNGKAFSAGHDLREMRDNRHSKKYFLGLFAHCSRVMQCVADLPVPVIARVHGIATAAGCQLCAACDIVIASASARFAVSGINQGLFCSTPAVPLSRAIHPKQAFEMLVTGRFVPAQEALQLGLVSRVVPDGELDDTVAELTREIVSKSAAAIRLGKAMFSKQRAMSIPEAYAFAGEVQAQNMMLEDAGEGLNAFIEKRQPVWKNR